MSHKKAKYAKKHKDRLFRFIFNDVGVKSIDIA